MGDYLFKPAKNSIRRADLYSSWFVTDNDLNTSTKGADLNLHRFKVLYLGRKTLNTIFSHVSATDICNCFKETGALSGMDAIEVCDRYVRRKVHISSVLHL